MNECILCKKDMSAIGGSLNEYALVEELYGDTTLVGEICESCGKKMNANIKMVNGFLVRNISND